MAHVTPFTYGLFPQCQIGRRQFVFTIRIELFGSPSCVSKMRPNGEEIVSYLFDVVDGEIFTTYVHSAHYTLRIRPVGINWSIEPPKCNTFLIIRNDMYFCYRADGLEYFDLPLKQIGLVYDDLPTATCDHTYQLILP